LWAGRAGLLCDASLRDVPVAVVDLIRSKIGGR